MQAVSSAGKALARPIFWVNVEGAYAREAVCGEGSLALSAGLMALVADVCDWVEIVVSMVGGLTEANRAASEVVQAIAIDAELTGVGIAWNTGLTLSDIAVF